MIREEFNFSKIKNYLYKNIDLLIAGIPGPDERTIFFTKIWFSKSKDVLLIKQQSDKFIYQFYKAGIKKSDGLLDLTIGIPRILRELKVQEKNVLLDLSGLDHVLIMYLAKVITCQVIPRTFFASYIRPKKYEGVLTDKILGLNAVPGFVKREKAEQILCAFIGFEGIRLKGIIESINNIDRLVPIVAFPSGSPQWYNVAMWNSRDLLQDNAWESTIYKCFSESIFEAIDLLKDILPDHKQVVLAPIGTRPHSLASAIYACHRSNVRIVFDYAIENENRAEGIAEIKIYHLTPFLNLE